MILVVEDSRGHIDLIQRAFEDNDPTVEVVFVPTLEEAWARIARCTPELVILDLILPDGKGTDFLADPRGHPDYPVVIMTSHGDERIAVEAMKAGALDYVVKSGSAFAEMPHLARRAIREWRHVLARRAAEQAVRRSEVNLRTFFDHAAQGILIVDSDHAIVRANRESCNVFGFAPDELIGQPIGLVIPETQITTYSEALGAYLQDSSRISRVGVEAFGKRKNGTTFPMEISISHAMIDDQMHIILLLVDITERKALEAQAAESQRIQAELEREKRLRQDKDRFLSMISHEFRTPLTVIRSSADILKRYYARLPEEERASQFHKIESEVRALDHMIADILLLSKTGMNLVEFKPQPVEIGEFCQQIVDYVGKSTHTERIELVSRVAQTVYPLDVYLVEHILINLLSNALKYSPPHAPVRFEVSETAEGLTFRVSDQGMGIPPEEIAGIFDPFRRGTNTSNIDGTGVGLAIVKEFVRLHRGTVSCQSELNKGTAFLLELPIHESVDHR